MYSKFFALFFAIPFSITACDITATMTSQTYHLVYAQFTFHNETRSPVYQFNQDGEMKTVHITGTFCNMKPTRLDAYKTYPKLGDKPCGSSQAFIEGFGYVNYVVRSKLCTLCGLKKFRV
ncbi:TransThyretin-Related family domain [Caenorhabditis elegans]|uniref:TransThyretin-Related family domain n=1 Tax=Caenorhabditis elegans TaxID=6239 RepID=H9G300_CAEEL|nr:TransThyretin-Related family domain [Caenorhabditis elegans]CCG28053.1 TransThyretin-Related family domain [Caenorhabditis elegans]|eukprot:NP_001255964.1 Uncharacterized protein CELE_F11E6.4 [Caenorhabditis elegans]